MGTCIAGDLLVILFCLTDCIDASGSGNVGQVDGRVHVGRDGDIAPYDNLLGDSGDRVEP